MMTNEKTRLRADRDLRRRMCGMRAMRNRLPPEVMRLSERLHGHGYHPAAYLGSGCTACGTVSLLARNPQRSRLTAFSLRRRRRSKRSHRSVRLILVEDQTDGKRVDQRKRGGSESGCPGWMPLLLRLSNETRGGAQHSLKFPLNASFVDC
jgi:hypothetical protein